MNDEAFAILVRQSISIRQVLLWMGLKGAGGNYLTVKRRIVALKLNTDHFLGQRANKGRRFGWVFKEAGQTLEERIASYKGGSSRLKGRLFREGLLEQRCADCKRRRWRGQPIPLELHHRNGDPLDNRLENLCVLCPNCHALTPNYRARNVRSRREARAQVVE